MSYFAGIDQLPLECLRGHSCGLLTNAGALSADGRRTVEALRDSGADLRVLFSPEHGLAGTAAEGANVEESRDFQSGLPVYSLYGKNKEIPSEALELFQVMVIDLPDVGVRYYTYPDTVFKVLESCATTGRPVVLLDRANPLGRITEGPLLETECASDVGRFPIPVRHGMTLGEYARLAIQRFGVAPGVDLTVIPPRFTPDVENPCFLDFGRPWQNPSPNLRSFEALCCYPGTCLFEGTNLSEGRGTSAPFQRIGAPFLEPERVLQQMGRNHFPGLELHPAEFTPDASKFAGIFCRGVEFHVTNPRECRSFEAALRLLDAIWKIYPDAFQFRAEHFDHLLGTRRYRLGIAELEECLGQN